MGNVIYIQEGQNTFAWATEIPNRHHSMFKVSFKDNYENIFFTDVETGQWIEEDMGFTALATEVGKQIKKVGTMRIHVPKLLTWHYQLVDNKLFSFGFYSYMNGCNKLYEIYSANKKYMYTLVDMDNDEWQILGNSDILVSKLDPVFANQVIKILPLYCVNVK